MRGAIIEKGEIHHTYLPKIFSAIRNVQNNYNWLITNYICYPKSEEIKERLFSKEYCWMDGGELTNMVEAENLQWIWGLLSGFDKSIPLCKVLESPLPYVDSYNGFWKNPISIQHPLASIEIAAIDSSYTLMISKDDTIISDFMNTFTQSEDLSCYNLQEM